MPRRTSVDPQVQELADAFVSDMLRTRNKPVVPSVRAELIDRAAAAMQQAVEDELEAIERELFP